LHKSKSNDFSLKLRPIIMDKMLSNWREEQLQIASKACIIADDNSQLKRCRGSSEEFSTCTYSIKEKLIGGVDVSFGDDPQSDQAIAVYVVTRNHQVIYQDSMVFTLSQPYVSSYLGEYFGQTSRKKQ
jgi:deoxyinosine 3'endonuclease (endonuclease V)